MRPSTTTTDLPSTYDVSNYIQNAFVEYLQDVQARIQVSICLNLIRPAELTNETLV